MRRTRWPAQSPPDARSIATVAAWVVALLIFFPILCTFLTASRPSGEAIAVPPALIPSTGRWRTIAEVQAQQRLLQALHELGDHRRSARPSSALLIAVPAAWSMAFSPTKRTKDILMWMLSTKMMPAVGVLVPIYLIFRRPRPARHAASA